jgi:histidinol-phosphatase
LYFLTFEEIILPETSFLSVALEAAKAAEAVIRRYYKSDIEIELKADQSPVTVADIETEKMIREIILGAFPEHGFYGEETGQTNPDADYLWLIDPIDGTKSFVREYPFFSTQIALMCKGKIITGVSNGLMFDELAWASRGEGAFLNGERLSVSKINDLETASLSTGNIASLAGDSRAWGKLADIMTQVNRTRGYGDFYHYHLLASGKIDLIIESDVNILDIAALSLIVEEAGGCFSDLKGEPVSLDTVSVIASANTDLQNNIQERFRA